MRICLILTALLSSVCSANDWPRFRGLDGNAAAPAANIPLTWSESENLLWKQPLPGHGSSSPAVFSDRIYLTAWSGYGLEPDEPGDRADLKLHVLCLDRDTGKVIWDRSMDAAADEQNVTRRIADHGFATGTPAVDAHGVYAYFGVSGLIAFSHDGEQLWHKQTGTKTAGFGTAASPITYRNLVIINASIESQTVFAFDHTTGKEAWKIEGIERSWTTPIVGRSESGRDELIISYRMQVRGFDPLQGKELWTCEGIQDYVVPCVVTRSGIAWVIGGRKNQSMAIKLGGSGNVTESHRLWDTNVGANVTSPIIHEGRLYWASDRGIANCLDASTGDVIYQSRLGSKGRVYASAVLANRHLFIPTRGDGVIVAPLSDEFKEVHRNTIEGDEGIYNATPAITGDRLLLRTHSHLYCIGSK
ncbi:MAG TPA: serine/threonine protein kinase [Planctomycetaceae bacterium]|nr:serine/threonine protein kinase [Planctomycetaceae bacterium]